MTKIVLSEERTIVNIYKCMHHFAIIVFRLKQIWLSIIGINNFSKYAILNFLDSQVYNRDKEALFGEYQKKVYDILAFNNISQSNRLSMEDRLNNCWLKRRHLSDAVCECLANYVCECWYIHIIIHKRCRILYFQLMQKIEIVVTINYWNKSTPI